MSCRLQKRADFGRESRFQRWPYFVPCLPGALPQAESECRAFGAKHMGIVARSRRRLPSTPELVPLHGLVLVFL